MNTAHPHRSISYPREAALDLFQPCNSIRDYTELNAIIRDEIAVIAVKARLLLYY